MFAYIKSKVVISAIISSLITLGLGVLSYFFIDNLTETASVYNRSATIIFQVDEIQRIYSNIQVSIDSSEEQAAMNFSDELIYKIKQLKEMTSTEDPILALKITELEKLQQDLHGKLPILTHPEFASVHDLLESVKTNAGNYQIDLQASATRQFYNFIYTFSALLVAGLVFPVLMALSLRNSLKKWQAMERKFREVVALNVDLYDNAPCGYFTVNNDRMISKINATLLHMLNYRKREIEDKLHITEVLNVDQSWVDDLMLKIKEEGLVENMDVEIINKGGRLTPVLINASLKSDRYIKGNNIRFTLFDNTERKAASERVTALNKELEAFTYSVSHDLRAPLRSINGYAQLLKEDYHHALDQEGVYAVDALMRNSSKMGQLIDDLLNFSRLNRRVVSKNFVDMNLLVTSLFHELLHGERKSIEFIKKELPGCFADYTLIQQVWVNLLSNAIKYSSKRERPVIEVGFDETPDHITYYVKDNGTGFDMNYAAKLFGVFQRLHSEEEFQGTGVGLALTKRIVDRHDGSIWATSVLHEGATFYFTLPKISDVNLIHSA